MNITLKSLKISVAATSFIGIFIALLECQWFCKLSSILIVFIISFLGVLIWFKKTNKITIFKKGNISISAIYDDLLNLKHHSNDKPVIVIPANSTFDVIVEDDLSLKDPIVSSKSIHGKWLNYILEKDFFSTKKLNSSIKNSLKNNGFKIIRKSKSKRGNKDYYELGSYAFIETENVTYLVFALTEFDDHNKVVTKNCCEFNNLISKLIDATANCQGREIFIPIMGTGLSNFNINHRESFAIIKNSLIGKSAILRSKVNIVVYKDDNSEVKIYE